jgi:hypothetical protein
MNTSVYYFTIYSFENCAAVTKGFALCFALGFASSLPLVQTQSSTLSQTCWCFHNWFAVFYHVHFFISLFSLSLSFAESSQRCNHPISTKTASKWTSHFGEWSGIHYTRKLCCTNRAGKYLIKTSSPFPNEQTNIVQYNGRCFCPWLCHKKRETHTHEKNDRKVLQLFVARNFHTCLSSLPWKRAWKWTLKFSIQAFSLTRLLLKLKILSIAWAAFTNWNVIFQ